MNFKTGYAFNATELFANFKITNITTHFSVLKKYYKTKEKKEMAIKVFLYAIYLILLDIIENNVTFVLPTSNRSQIQMKSFSGEKFKTARQNGKFKDVDLINSNCTGYQLEFYYERKKSPRHKLIYVDNKLKQKITNNTNNGKIYV